MWGSELRAEKGPLVVEVGLAWATLSGCRGRMEVFSHHSSLTGLSFGFCHKWKQDHVGLLSP